MAQWPKTTGSIVNHIDGRSLQVASDKFARMLANRFGRTLEKYMKDRGWDATKPEQLMGEVEALLIASAPHVYQVLSMELGYEPVPIGGREWFSGDPGAPDPE